MKALTDRQAEVMLAVDAWQAKAPGSWFRPREVKVDEHYTAPSAILMQLVRRGLVERSQLGANVGYGGWSYRATFAGRSWAVQRRALMDEATAEPYTDLHTLGFHARTHNLLRRSGYHTVEQLRGATVGELSGIRGLGVGMLNQIFAAIK
ncbi:hypothetical protein SEA_MITHRIL_57 [Mycobacterium phage Mithril]|uniref:RNA polymerase alpha subunit C-terminal domain-containing protein n=1 Tax=Mycobacterium phage Mithril TaxID=2653765 RepID=A0A5Q2WLP1_9CAUD|nr:hypothetical protein SEA_MITHRIL_57 [Mycobacterium phage Mithril]